MSVRIHAWLNYTHANWSFSSTWRCWILFASTWNKIKMLVSFCQRKWEILLQWTQFALQICALDFQKIPVVKTPKGTLMLRHVFHVLLAGSFNRMLGLGTSAKPQPLCLIFLSGRPCLQCQSACQCKWLQQKQMGSPCCLSPQRLHSFTQHYFSSLVIPEAHQQMCGSLGKKTWDFISFLQRLPLSIAFLWLLVRYICELTENTSSFGSWWNNRCWNRAWASLSL